MFTETITALTNRTAELQNAAETAHNAWRDSKGAPGTFDAWTEAISELTENETALALLTNIATKMDEPATELTYDEYNTNAADLAWTLGRTLGLIHWDAVSRVDHTVAELEINHASITPKQAAEIERCIAADIKAGK